MDSLQLFALAGILVLGVGAQWIAWRLRLPGILLLLLVGFLAGPAFHWIEPDKLLGDLLFPVVSLSVGLILFEGGLSLKLSELRQMGRTLANLLLIGAPVTWLLSALFGNLFLGLAWPMALLLGAVLVVTGPTVVLPLLRLVRPKGQTGSLLKWEGILIDPVGATLALLVFEAISIGGGNKAAMEVVQGIILTLGVGISLGVFGGWVLSQTLRRYWIPDHLQNPVTILLVTSVFAASDLAQHESGLLAVTVMGIYLANQRSADITHIVEFKENIRVLLISALFIVLSARLDLAAFKQLPLGAIFFFAAMVLVVRPVSVWLSTWKSSLTRNEKIFLMCMAPRGIVAASVASIFALRLTEDGYAGGELLVPATFLIIVGTVTLYGLAAGPIARKLELAEPNPNGILLVGAHRWSRSLAQELADENITVLLADTNYAYISAARMQGFRTYFGNVLSEHAEDEMNLSGIGRLVALTANDEVNTLASVRYGELFGRSEVYQLSRESDQVGERYHVAERLRGRTLFSDTLTYKQITHLCMNGAEFKKTPLTEEFPYERFLEHHQGNAYPMFLIDGAGGVKPFTVKDPPKSGKGMTLISLVMPSEDKAA